jgi:Uncharacterised nucleotidyltransferase
MYVYRLSRTQQLLLKAAILSNSGAIAAWQQWKSEVDIETLDDASNVLLPQLYQNLLAHGIDDPEMARLKGVYRRTWYGNQLQLKTLKLVLGALAARNIPVIRLGDSAIEPYSRAIFSFYLLVRDMDEAIDCLNPLDWRVAPADSTPTQICLIHVDQGRLYLRDYLLWAPGHPHLTHKTWQQRIIHGEAALLSPGEQFLYLCTQTFYKKTAQSMYGIVDAASLLKQFETDADWFELITQTQRYQAILPVRNMLLLLKNLLEVPLPSWVLVALRQMPIAQAEWRTYRVLAGDRRSMIRAFMAQCARPFLFLEYKLL